MTAKPFQNTKNMRYFLSHISLCARNKSSPNLEHSPKCLYSNEMKTVPRVSISSVMSGGSVCSSMDETSSASLIDYSNSQSSCSSNLKNSNVPYNKSRQFCCRHSEAMLLREKHPGKIPLIIEMFTNEKKLKPMEKCQFVLPKFATVGQLQHLIRKRVCEGRRMSVYILADGGEIPSLNTTIAEIAAKHRSDDGFTYLKYSSEDSLG